jgi:hypothetical protein
MGRDGGEKGTKAARAGSAPAVIRTDGEDVAKGYAMGEVAQGPLCPTEEMERVRIEDPRRLPAPRELEQERQGSGPRNPEQRAPLREKGPGIEFPENLPAHKKQPILIDSEVLLQWHEERRKREEAEERSARTAATTVIRVAGAPARAQARAQATADVDRPQVEGERAGTALRSAWIAVALVVAIAAGLVVSLLWDLGSPGAGSGAAPSGTATAPAASAGAAPSSSSRSASPPEATAPPNGAPSAAPASAPTSITGSRAAPSTKPVAVPVPATQKSPAPGTPPPMAPAPPPATPAPPPAPTIPPEFLE